jgi:hypothetical protein
MELYHAQYKYDTVVYLEYTKFSEVMLKLTALHGTCPTQHKMKTQQSELISFPTLKLKQKRKD